MRSFRIKTAFSIECCPRALSLLSHLSYLKHPPKICKKQINKALKNRLGQAAINFVYEWRAGGNNNTESSPEIM